MHIMHSYLLPHNSEYPIPMHTNSRVNNIFVRKQKPPNAFVSVNFPVIKTNTNISSLDNHKEQEQRIERTMETAKVEPNYLENQRT